MDKAQSKRMHSSQEDPLQCWLRTIKPILFVAFFGNQIGHWQGAFAVVVVTVVDLLHPDAADAELQGGQMQCVWFGRRFGPFTDWVRPPPSPIAPLRSLGSPHCAAKREECLVPSLSAAPACPLFFELLTVSHSAAEEGDQGTGLILLIPRLSPPSMLLFDMIMLIINWVFGFLLFPCPSSSSWAGPMSWFLLLW